MDVTPLIPQGKQIIDGYGEGGFRISGQRVEGSVIVFPDKVIAWGTAAVSDMGAGDLEPVSEAGRAGAVELLLVGTGARMTQIDRTLRQALRANGVVIEVMDTGAACRTYNVLMAEGRRVAAALIAVA
ncbi:Mth938-like domain-containing protein [Dongia deserti]|uniref:Mth938-like domain-containing protein n=1 Tax=Dongia deserti TaxID=2268030 RepID=UPI000E64EFE6|nr:Mth938-like domain-containing protein [Dongia deserti]